MGICVAVINIRDFPASFKSFYKSRESHLYMRWISPIHTRTRVHTYTPQIYMPKMKRPAGRIVGWGLGPCFFALPRRTRCWVWAVGDACKWYSNVSTPLALPEVFRLIFMIYEILCIFNIVCGYRITLLIAFNKMNQKPLWFRKWRPVPVTKQSSF